MKTIQIEIPDGKEAKWVNNVLTLVDEKPVEFKYKVGDKVKIKGVNQVQTITCIALYNGTPVYKTDGNSTHTEEQIELYTKPQNITERIKTFEDAKDWCAKNGYEHLVEDWCITTPYYEEKAKDISAYLKLRIITCALNEGWEPKDELAQRCYAFVLDDGNIVTNGYSEGCFGCDSAIKLSLKSQKLAKYAANQFKDIYMVFCHKGKE